MPRVPVAAAPSLRVCTFDDGPHASRVHAGRWSMPQFKEQRYCAWRASAGRSLWARCASSNAGTASDAGTQHKQRNSARQSAGRNAHAEQAVHWHETQKACIFGSQCIPVARYCPSQIRQGTVDVTPLRSLARRATNEAWRAIRIDVPRRPGCQAKVLGSMVDCRGIREVMPMTCTSWAGDTSASVLEGRDLSLYTQSLVRRARRGGHRDHIGSSVAQALNSTGAPTKTSSQPPPRHQPCAKQATRWTRNAARCAFASRVVVARQIRSDQITEAGQPARRLCARVLEPPARTPRITGPHYRRAAPVVTGQPPARAS